MGQRAFLRPSPAWAGAIHLTRGPRDNLLNINHPHDSDSCSRTQWHTRRGNEMGKKEEENEEIGSSTERLFPEQNIRHLMNRIETVSLRTKNVRSRRKVLPSRCVR